MQKVVVAGSAHLNIVARPAFSGSALDTPGSVTIVAGGTGYQVACNLAWLNCSVAFVTGLGKTSLADMLLRKPISLGVDVLCDFDSNLAIGGSSTHLDSNGLPLSIISSTTVEQANLLTPDVEDRIREARCLVLDCNLSGESMDGLLAYAESADVPSVAVSTSEERCLRLLGRTAKLTLAVFSKADLLHFLRKGVFPVSDQLRTSSYLSSSSVDLYYAGTWVKLQDISRWMGCSIVVTTETDGLLLASPDQACWANAGTGSGPNPVQANQDVVLSYLVKYLTEHDAWSFEALRRSLKKTATSIELLTAEERQGLASRVLMEDELDKVHQLNCTDSLTGLLNRRGLAQEVKALSLRALLRKLALSAIIVDLDHFKNVNDRFGHGVGDIVLGGIAKAIKDTVREADIAVRTGGEEFLVVLPGETQAKAKEVAERLSLAVRELRFNATTLDTGEDEQFGVTVSIGVSQARLGDDFEKLVHRADTALYSAKRGGRNRVICM